MCGFKQFSKTGNLQIFRPVGLDIVLSSFFFLQHFLVVFCQERVFMKITTRPETLPVTFQNVNNSPAPPSIDMSPKWTLNTAN